MKNRVFCQALIRIKNNTITTNSRGLVVDIDALFYSLKPGEKSPLKGKRKVWGHDLYLEGLRLLDGELLIVATDQLHEDTIKIYGIRWEIEILFGCLKGRGFNFEDTHIIDGERIKKVFALLAIAFCRAHKTGEWQNEVKPIRIKKHGRPAVSLFRYSLDYIIGAIVNVFCDNKMFRNCLEKLQFIPALEKVSGGL